MNFWADLHDRLRPALRCYGVGKGAAGAAWELDQKQMILTAKVGMLLLTLLASWLATMTLPALFSLAVLVYQGIIHLAVPQFLGIFWKRGNKYGAIAVFRLATMGLTQSR